MERRKKRYYNSERDDAQSKRMQEPPGEQTGRLGESEALVLREAAQEAFFKILQEALDAKNPDAPQGRHLAILDALHGWGLSAEDARQVAKALRITATDELMENARGSFARHIRKALEAQCEAKDLTTFARVLKSLDKCKPHNGAAADEEDQATPSANYSGPTFSASGHITLDAARAIAHGELPAKDLPRAEEHLSKCDFCPGSVDAQRSLWDMKVIWRDIGHPELEGASALPLAYLAIHLAWCGRCLRRLQTQKANTDDARALALGLRRAKAVKKNIK